MKSFCTSGLVLLASLSWAASHAAGQAATHGARQSVTSSYHLPSVHSGSAGSMFTAGLTPTPANTEDPQEIIDGAHGPSDFQEALDGQWIDGTAQSVSPGAWFATAGGLAMGRSRANAFRTSFLNNAFDPVLNTQDAGANWAGGWQFTLGYMFGGCCGHGGGAGPYGPLGAGATTGPGIAFTYWGLGAMDGQAQFDSPANQLFSSFLLLDPGTVSGEVEINGQPFSFFYDNSASHRITRSDSASNYELNLFFGTFNHYRWTIVPFAGFRYFRFEEQLGFSGLTSGGDWNNPADYARLSFRTTNNLYGLQLGSYATYQVAGNFSWFLGPKLGLLGNQMINRSIFANGAGAQGFDLTGYKSDFSLMGEIDTGFSWVFGPHFMAYAGYRVLGFTNVALGDNQFIDGIGSVQQNGSLILHGMMMGGGWTF